LINFVLSRGKYQKIKEELTALKLIFFMKFPCFTTGVIILNDERFFYLSLFIFGFSLVREQQKEHESNKVSRG